MWGCCFQKMDKIKRAEGVLLIVFVDCLKVIQDPGCNGCWSRFDIGSVSPNLLEQQVNWSTQTQSISKSLKTLSKFIPLQIGPGSWAWTFSRPDLGRIWGQLWNWSQINVQFGDTRNWNRNGIGVDGAAQELCTCQLFGFFLLTLKQAAMSRLKRDGEIWLTTPIWTYRGGFTTNRWFIVVLQVFVQSIFGRPCGSLSRTDGWQLISSVVTACWLQHHFVPRISLRRSRHRLKVKTARANSEVRSPKGHSDGQILWCDLRPDSHDIKNIDN